MSEDSVSEETVTFKVRRIENKEKWTADKKWLGGFATTTSKYAPYIKSAYNLYRNTDKTISVMRSIPRGRGEEMQREEVDIDTVIKLYRVNLKHSLIKKGSDSRILEIPEFRFALAADLL